MTRPSLAQLVTYFVVLGATGFGGPVALANYMRADLFERRRWFSDDEYEQGLALATALPGPMAYKLAVYCGYVAHGVAGGVAVGLAFALAPFVLVVLVAIAYSKFAASDVVRGLFYGVGPVVVALILNASVDLGVKTLKRDVPAWVVAIAALVATVVLQRELTVLFVAAGVLGIFLFAPPPPAPQTDQGAPPPSNASAHAWPLLVAALPAAATATAWQLFAFFFKAGLLVFGSGLVIVSFVKAYVVDQYHWIDNRTFLDAVAIGMISPGPVVITATFVGYMIGGFAGALAATGRDGRRRGRAGGHDVPRRPPRHRGRPDAAAARRGACRHAPVQEGARPGAGRRRRRRRPDRVSAAAAHLDVGTYAS